MACSRLQYIVHRTVWLVHTKAASAYIEKRGMGDGLHVCLLLRTLIYWVCTKPNTAGGEGGSLLAF